MRFFLSSTPPDLPGLRRELLRTDAGALATFEGWVRAADRGRPVSGLEYEAFGPLAEKEGLQVLGEAAERFPVLDAVCVHRVGRVAPGELAVWIGVTAVHRNGAFDACRFIIDTLKTRVPIWKKEYFCDGTAAWVEPPPEPRRV